MADNVDLVRRLWAAFEKGGMDAVYDIVDDDVEWSPYGAGGEVFRGKEGLREYMERRRERSEETEARLYSAFARGESVVARGEVRIRGPQGLVTMQPGWLYEFRDGKLVRFRGFPTQEAALRAAGLAPQDPASTVRQLWAAANRQDVDGIADLCTPDVEWVPYNGARPVYNGPDEVREYYGENYAQVQSISVEEYAFREFGSELVAFTGSLHVVDGRGAVAQRQLHYLFWVRAGKIYRAQSFAGRAEAMAAAEAAAAGQPG